MTVVSIQLAPVEQAEAFDPWTCGSVEDALQAREQWEPHNGESDPLVQYMAAQEVSSARAQIDGPDGGLAMLLALRHCLVHKLATPEWLSDAFVRRHTQVLEAEAGSWDEAFGRPWPIGTRLSAVRKQRRLKRAIHAAVWDLLTSDPHQGVNRDLFEQIGERREISVSGSYAERLYFEALRDGMPNPLLVRQSTSTAQSHESREFSGTEKHLD